MCLAPYHLKHWSPAGPRWRLEAHPGLANAESGLRTLLPSTPPAPPCCVAEPARQGRWCPPRRTGDADEISEARSPAQGGPWGQQGPSGAGAQLVSHPSPASSWSNSGSELCPVSSSRPGDSWPRHRCCLHVHRRNWAVEFLRRRHGERSQVWGQRLVIGV